MKKAFVAVINDLTHDQRVARTCSTLFDLKIVPTLFGRRLNQSGQIKRQYPVFRKRLLFNRGALFYAEINIRIFFFALFKRFDLYFSNDLDTLLAMYLLAKLHRKPLIYDSHELFTEVPELKNRGVRKVWLGIEKSIFPKLKHVITVNQSIADIYSKRYGVDVNIVRNISSNDIALGSGKEGLSKLQLILQGNGINKDRGAEELVFAMRLIENAKLRIIGNGDVVPELKEIVKENGLQEKVEFYYSIPPSELKLQTQKAHIGFSLDKPTNENYVYSLPNKLFDYIHAGVVVIASNVVEVKRIVDKYYIGTVINDVTPESIAEAIQQYQESPELLKKQSENCLKASKELNWEREKHNLIKVINESLER